MYNYERYNKTRAPFGINQHIYWLANSQDVMQGFLQFIDFLLSLDHVYFVPVSKVNVHKHPYYIQYSLT